VATEAIRRAADGQAIVAEVDRAAGVPLHVLDHREEAILTLIGVTEGRPVAAELVVVDVGGGSTEFAVVGPDRPVVTWGLRLGAASLTASLVERDPPTADEVDRLLAAAAEAIAGAPDARPTEVVAVGGSASNVLRVLADSGGDRVLTRGTIDEALGVVRAAPAAAVAERFGVRPARARILPAGTVILAAVLERFALDCLRVSEAGIREGVILATLHDPIGWRDRLPQLARGWVR
jgi:exopolyphosphatase/guanosine-5'-triphosphate,3'-diphosphate pyrophosphatase